MSRPLSADELDDAEYRARLAPLARAVLPGANNPPFSPARPIARRLRLIAATSIVGAAVLLAGAWLYLPWPRAAPVPAAAPEHPATLPQAAVTPRPPVVTPQPPAAVAQPAVATPQGAVATRQPTVAKPQPASVTPQPAVVTPRPAVAKPQPAVAAAQTTVVTPRPAVAYPRPAVATPQPAVVTPQPAIVMPAPKPAPARTDTLTGILLERGNAAMADGDITAARLLFQRAADTGSAEAAHALGATYDIQSLLAVGARATYANPALAAQWYSRATELASTAANRSPPGNGTGR